MQAIRIQVNKSQWIYLINDLQQCLKIAPIEGWEVETCLLSEFYRSKISLFTFYKPGRSGKVTITIPVSVAFAINAFLSVTSIQYNLHLRPLIEPLLPPVRST